MVGVSNERMFRRLCAALNRPEWLEDPRFSTNPLRVKHCRELEAEMQKLFKDQPTTHWTGLFDEHDVPVSPIQNAEQVLNDPQLAALGQLGTMTLADQHAEISVPRLPFELSMTPTELAAAPPIHGEHGRAILVEAGYSEAEIEQLVASGVCNLP